MFVFQESHIVFKMIKENLPGFIFAFIVLGSWSASNFYQLNSISEKTIEFEKSKAAENIKLSEQKLLIEKEKIRLDALGTNLNELKNQSIEKAKEAEAKLSLTKKQEQYQTLIASRAQEENEIKGLIKEFSELGINLNVEPTCRPEDISKYNKAISLMSQITGRVNAAGVNTKYKDFINTNRRWIFFGATSCKNDPQ